MLAAWSESTDADKRLLFEYHLEWAWDHRAMDQRALDAIIALLSSMKPEDWRTEQ
jgi:hypothetical protein